MKKNIFHLSVVFALALAGCWGSTPPPKASRSGGTPSKKAGGAISNDMFAFTIDSLNRLEQFQTGSVQEEITQQIYELRKTAAASSAPPESTLLAAWPESDTMRQIVDRLNQWIRAQQPPEWKRDPLPADLPEALRNLPIVAGLEKMEIGPFDGYYLQEAVYLRDVALAARGKSIDDRLRASRLFDWTVRNVQLDDETPERIPQFPWETLFFGHGTAWERAWVFVLLARQEGLEAAILAIEKKDSPRPTNLRSVPGEGPGVRAESPQPWCVAVRIEGKAYLFDPVYGLPIPGPGGLKKGANGQLDLVPATLDQLLADESLLARMNTDAEHPYHVSPSDLKSVVALVEASPTALSRRMKAVESHLKGAQKMVLTASASEQAEHWKSAPGIAGAGLWRLPYETIRRRSELKPLQIAKLLASFLPFYAMPSDLHSEEVARNAAKTPPDMRNIYKGGSADDGGKTGQNSPNSMQDTESKKYERVLKAITALRSTFSAPLYKGRVLQLKGQLSGDVSAMNYYQMSRPSPEEMQIIQEKLFAQSVRVRVEDNKNLTDEEKEKLVRNVVEAILTGKTLRDAESQQLAVEIGQNYGPFVEEQMMLIQLGKMNASYWLGLVTYERGSYPQAADYFGKRTLLAWPDGFWTTGAIYNLGRTLETAGEFDQAVKVYRSNTAAAGQLLRAKWLREANEKKADE